MLTLPQLIEEDIQQLDDILSELLNQAQATTTLIMDKAGFLINHQGDARKFDLTTIAALASGAYMATQTIANLVEETNFNSVYQQGDVYSIFTICIDEHCLLVVIFRAQLSAGAIKYFAVPAAQKIALQLKSAQERDPGAGFDLSVLNVADTESLFRKTGTET